MIFVKKYFFAIRLLYETRYAKYRKKNVRGAEEKKNTQNFARISDFGSQIFMDFGILDTDLDIS